MSELIFQLVLYAYPIWAFIAFVVGLAFLVDYIWNINRTWPVLITGIVHIGWALAFFGAGLLIAGLVDRAWIVPTIQAIWIIVLPLFAYVGGVKCWETWQTLRHLDERKKK